MQEKKNLLFIDDFIKNNIKIILINEQEEITQYKILENNQSKLNNIYSGIIEKIDYSIESFFLKLEDNLYGFLPFKNLNNQYYSKERNHLKKHFSKGDKLMVQVLRDSIDKKLLKLTNCIVISGKNCNYFPDLDNNHGISSNIKGEIRGKLKVYLNELKIKGSIIIRTSAQNETLEEIENDFQSLISIWKKLKTSFNKSTKAELLFQYDDLLHILRSYSIFLIEKVLVRTNEMLNRVKNYAKKQLINFPEIKLLNNEINLTKIVDQINDFYKFEIMLPSKGSILIQKTEAMITIDINSNKSHKESNLELTAFKTNLEAIKIIAELILLRNLGGIISIDLIDMKNQTNIDQINEFFKAAFKADKASNKIIPINDLCILQISRERKGLSLIDKHYEKCTQCKGYGLKLKDDFLISNFIYKLSSYDINTNLNININAKLFNELFANHYSFIKKYKNLNWQITQEDLFEIN